MTRLRVATWNINSLRLRHPLLTRLREALDPDVICLQETKVPDELFPDGVPGELGYPLPRASRDEGLQRRRHPLPHSARRRMRTRRIGARRAIAAMPPPRWRPRAARWSCTISTCPPAATWPTRRSTRNSPISSPSSSEATNWFAARRPERCILVGDLNIAPLEHDVWSHKQLLTVVSHTPVEVEHLNAWLRTGFADAMRHFVPADEKLYTWWSYRNQDWRRSNRGRRLDHVWVTPGPGAGAAQARRADRRPRLGAQLRPRPGLRRARRVDIRRSRQRRYVSSALTKNCRKRDTVSVSSRTAHW